MKQIIVIPMVASQEAILRGIVRKWVGVVESDKDLVQIDSAMLESFGYGAHCCGDCKLFSMFLQGGARDDLYILDAELRETLGAQPKLIFPEMAGEIRRYHPKAKIVVRGNQDYSALAKEAGVDFIPNGHKGLGTALSIANHYFGADSINMRLR